MQLPPNKKIVLLSLVCAMASAGQADHKTAFTGIWKLNVAKSDFGGRPAPASVVITNAADGTFQVNISDGQGKTMKWSHGWSGGAEVPYEGLAEGATVVTRVRGETWDETIKIDGKIAEIVRVVLGLGGRTMTSTIDRTKNSPMGEGHLVLLYEKQ